ncbi:hypothetical protein C8R48DRAFT_676772 [Suillus tomentosus]|nr:hypothetical protein C8R48DRAFT_676772 [Suillus tomentosus]
MAEAHTNAFDINENQPIHEEQAEDVEEQARTEEQAGVEMQAGNLEQAETCEVTPSTIDYAQEITQDDMDYSINVQRMSEGAGNFGRTFQTGKQTEEQLQGQCPKQSRSGGPRERSRWTSGNFGGSDEWMSGGSELRPREFLPRPEMDID